MRVGLKNLKEFHQLDEWIQYVTTYMPNTNEQYSDNEIEITTRCGDVIAVWQRQGYGYVEECRTVERLTGEKIAKVA